MILKIVKKVVNQKDVNNTKVTDEVIFFDGFNYLTKKCFNKEDIEKRCGSYDSSFFTLDNTEKVLAMWLMKGNVIVRYIVIDLSCGAFLMSDTGKTIERIN